jgi:dipeptidyl aminopeptidase/acylaminoacyl peptidase
MPVRFVDAGGRQIAFNPAGAGPRLIPSPTDPSSYVFEQGGTLRRLTAAGIVSPAVADVVRNFNRLALLAKEKPEGHYLLWAADPLWSSDGRYLAYATNRESILAGTTEQSIWVVDVDAGRERPLLAGRGESFGGIGWLGNTLLYTDGSGGISSVDAQTGKRRKDIPGFHLAVDIQGTSLAYAVGPTPEHRKMSVLQRGAPFDVPAPPAGYMYEAYADFSPNGNALLLIARNPEGRTKLAVFSLLTRTLQSADLPGVPESSLLINRPAWVQNDAVLVTTAERTSGREESRLVRVPQHPGR